jgi:hypothetical protein
MAENKTRFPGFKVEDLREVPTQVKSAADGAIRAWRTQAKRSDRVGDVSYRSLELVHGGLGAAVRSLGRLEKATQPPTRATRNQPHRPSTTS